MRHQGMRTQRGRAEDRKSTRLNSSHGYISYALFCLKKTPRQIEADTPHPLSPACPPALRLLPPARGWRSPQNAAGLCCALWSQAHAWFSFFNDTATTEIYTLSLHDALPI